ncbi:hypothetical protein [Leptospira noguchii]|uniref:hypothetical protein n=1 Tax=Leptospira noguchii TaxID=28182 RepID=UPI003D73BE57
MDEFSTHLCSNHFLDQLVSDACGTTDTRHILEIVKISRNFVWYSVMIQLESLILSIGLKLQNVISKILMVVSLNVVFAEIPSAMISNKIFLYTLKYTFSFCNSLE